ncbi:MAG: class I SAM-dependent methyltransferase [Brumimicrobium sp.]|nr:class I SAM-dependent methyltransferase [Brumimicrobium sp.]
MNSTDPIGNAILDYHAKQHNTDIIVSSNLMEDDVIPIDYLFRGFTSFPKLEKLAIKNCVGHVLDIGAAAGPHAKHLASQGYEVTTVEVSQGAHTYLKETLPQAHHYLSPILNFNHGKYDTILLLMNGIGIAGTLVQITPFLRHLSGLLTPNGKILCESTDVKYFYEDDEGGTWFDLNAQYYGEFKFNMHYKEIESGWFDWIYLDAENFKKCAKDAGLDHKIIGKDGPSFLMELKKLV